jgi:hypothetical protein
VSLLVVGCSDQLLGVVVVLRTGSTVAKDVTVT